MQGIYKDREKQREYVPVNKSSTRKAFGSDVKIAMIKDHSSSPEGENNDSYQINNNSNNVFGGGKNLH
jgi:hypothetical protein